MRGRDVYAHTSLDDVSRLRESLERGAELTKADANRMWGWHERKFRATVSRLREEGYPVVSWDEQGSRYRKAHDRAELEKFLDTVLLSRVRDLETQIRVLREGAERHFGSDQLRLAV